MNKKANLDYVIFILIIITTIIIVSNWYISNSFDFKKDKKIENNLNILQDIIDLSCGYDNFELDNLYLAKTNANLNIIKNEVCISDKNSIKNCRIVLCNSKEDFSISLKTQNKFKFKKDSDGFNLE